MDIGEILLLDTKEIKKENSVYYVCIVYISSAGESVQVFVNKNVYDYMSDLPSFEDVSTISRFSFDRKTRQFRLSFNIENI